MKRRVFVISLCRFPHGTATANYLLYFCKAVADGGDDVKLISDLNPDYQYGKKVTKIKDIDIHPLYFSKTPIGKIIKRYFLDSIFENVFKNENINKSDIVVSYFQESAPHKALFKLREKYGFRLAACVTEWFPDSYFSDPKMGDNYKCYFDELLPKYDLIIPISTYIQKHFESLNKETLLVPVMADIETVPVSEKTFDKLRFIYPGNGRIKDEMINVILAFDSLLPYEKEKVELHISGISEGKIVDILSKHGKRFSRDLYVVHDWMEYTELMALYDKMHFLFLARQKSQVTLSNFPSKVPETMCFGIVPIASDVGDYTSLYLRDGYDSIYLQDIKVQSIVNVIQMIIGMPVDDIIRLEKNAVDTARGKFDYHNWSTVITQGLNSL